ncbi:MAG TPA: PEGA domain-containing protein [Trueperaceae bacterium]
MKRLFALLLLTLVWAAPAWAQSQDGVVFSPQSIVINPRPGFDVDVFLDKGGGEGIPTYRVGEEISIGVRVSEDAYVYLFDVRPNGEITQLLPNRFDRAGQDNYLQAGETRYFPARNARYVFNAAPPRGLDKVIAVASRTQLDTRQLATFQEEGGFATSNLGEEGFARNLSIVVRPIEQQNWVTDTALLYVGDRPEQAAFGTLSVRSSPSDAAVYVDGQFVGYTPVSYGTRPGRHDVRVERQGYETFSQSVNLRPGSTTTVDATLQPVRRTGQVSFDSNPRRAEVYVDGRYVGTTPTGTIELEAGSYEARFSLPGYQDTFVRFDVRAGGSQTVSTQLVGLHGSLEIVANVGGAQVFLDGRYVGNIANGSGLLTIPDLLPGSYQLTVVAPGYRTYVSDVNIRAGESSFVRVRQEQQ